MTSTEHADPCENALCRARPFRRRRPRRLDQKTGSVFWSGPKIRRAAIAVILLAHLLPSATLAGDDAPAVEYLSESAAGRIIYMQQSWGELGLDTAVRPADNRIIKLRIKDKRYERGLGHHANGELVIALDGQYETFAAEVGVQWQGSNAGSVVFQVFVDDEKRFDSGVMTQQDPARKVQVRVQGADDLKLVVTDAGDGITCDCANWAEARLVRDPAAARQAEGTTADMAPFAHVKTWDPQRTSGTAAKRTEEFPAADVLLGKEVLPAADGSYRVPVYDGGLACVGLEWAERRSVRTLALELAAPAQIPALDQVRVESWQGESIWQGNWKPLAIDIQREGVRWIARVRYQQSPTARGGTEKIRWIFPVGPAEPVAVRTLAAHTNSRWRTAALRAELAGPAAGKQGQVEIYNGVILGPAGADLPRQSSWNLSAPLQLQIRYAKPSSWKTDRTVLRFRLPGGAFGVAVEDVLAGDGVYVPHAGLLVSRDPAPVTLAAYRSRIADRHTVLERVRARPDQTFAQAMAKVHNPIQDLGPTLLSLACDNRKFVAQRDGTITFGVYDAPDQTVDVPRTYPCRVTPQFGAGKSAELTRHLYGRWLPVPVTVVRKQGVVYRQQTFVAPVDDEPPQGGPEWLRQRPLCVAHYTVENTLPHAADASLSLTLTTDVKQRQPAELRRVDRGVVATHRDRLLAVLDCSAESPLAVRTGPGTITLAGTLPAGKTADCFLLVPGWKVDPDDHAQLAADDRWLDRVERYWKGLLASSIEVDLPDAFLSDVIRASQVHCLLAGRNEANGARIAAWIASDRYGPLESETHSVIRGMDMMGHDDFARRALEYLIRRYNKAGYLTTGYTIMGTGWHLWTLAEHYERTGDRAWLQGVAPEVARVCKWITKQCAKTRQLDGRREKLPEYGLVPPGVAADWNRYAYRFGAEAHYYAGLERAARALADIDYPGSAELLQEAEQFRANILRAYQWTQGQAPVLPLANGTWVPAYPGMLYCFGRIEDIIPGEDGNRSWAYDVELGAHHLAVNGVLDPLSRQATWMAEHMEDVWFLHDGMGDYAAARNHQDVFSLGGFSKVQPYYTRNAELYALRDDVKPFIRSYFNTIPSLLSLENLSFWEHFHNIGAWNKTHETGYFLAQTSLMLAMERGDQLWLAPLVTANWLKDGMKLAVGNAPTRFGKVSYTIRSSAGRGLIEADIEPPTRRPPELVVIRLRHPHGKPIRTVTVNGQPHTDFDAAQDTIRIRPSGARITVQARY